MTQQQCLMRERMASPPFSEPSVVMIWGALVQIETEKERENTMPKLMIEIDLDESDLEEIHEMFMDIDHLERGGLEHLDTNGIDTMFVTNGKKLTISSVMLKADEKETDDELG
jgi:hypothetical protein